MPQTVVAKWGESLIVRVPDDLAKAAGFDDGRQVEIVAADEELVIRKVSCGPTLEALFSGRSPEAWREIYADAYDWGPDHGRERVEE